MVSDQKDLVHMRVDATFDDVPRPDVLLAPGGPGTARYAAGGHPIVDWIRQAHPHPPFDAGSPSKASASVYGMAVTALGR